MKMQVRKNIAGVSSLGVPWHPQILADQLTLSQPGGADYARQIILAPPDFQTFLRPCIVQCAYILFRIDMNPLWQHNVGHSLYRKG